MPSSGEASIHVTRVIIRVRYGSDWKLETRFCDRKELAKRQPRDFLLAEQEVASFSAKEVEKADLNDSDLLQLSLDKEDESKRFPPWVKINHILLHLEKYLSSVQRTALNEIILTGPIDLPPDVELIDVS